MIMLLLLLKKVPNILNNETWCYVLKSLTATDKSVEVSKTCHPVKLQRNISEHHSVSHYFVSSLISVIHSYFCIVLHANLYFLY